MNDPGYTWQDGFFYGITAGGDVLFQRTDALDNAYWSPVPLTPAAPYAVPAPEPAVNACHLKAVAKELARVLEVRDS